MNKSILLGLLIHLFFQSIGQNPHGENLKIDCRKCHTPEGWTINKNELSFNHDSTQFILKGAHKKTDCNACHKSLVFKEASSQCVSCHTDVHSMSVGNDCARCHTENSWLIDNIPELHEQNGFPITGAHTTISCVDCHKSETTLRWDRIGNECISCHKADYENSKEPNHIQSGFSVNCTQCHEPNSNYWGNGNFHYFYSLTRGHDIKDCRACHKSNDFAAVSTECVSCHLDDYNNAVSQDHRAQNFSTQCSDCHSIDPGWQFTKHDDRFFPINSGKHRGTWNACSECHTTPGNLRAFSCISCHEHSNQNDLAKKHDDENGYSFDSNACYRCHPKGEED